MILQRKNCKLKFAIFAFSCIIKTVIKRKSEFFATVGCKKFKVKLVDDMYFL